MKYDPKAPKVMSQPAGADANAVRLLLDDDTIVLMRSMKSYLFWKTRYPSARLIDPLPESFTLPEPPGEPAV